MALPTIKLSSVDKFVNWVSPKRGLQRIQAKAAIEFMSSSGYVTSGSSKRSMRGWGPAAKTSDEDTLPKVEQARADSRDLFMNSNIATGALRRAVTNTIGGGLVLQSRIDDDALGIASDEAFEWERKTEREFNLWSSSKNCDVTRMQNFYELQELAFLNTLLSGDVFVAMPYVKYRGMPYDLKLKIIEADYCCNPNFMMDTEIIAGGIEVDKHGAPNFYHFKRSIPSKYNQLNDGWNKVKVFGDRTGRRNILHLLRKDRPGQRRGMPFLAPVIESLKNITRLSEAELMGSILSSFFTVFVTSQTGQEGLAGAFDPSESTVETDINGDPVSDPDKNVYEMGSANIIDLAPGDDIKMADPKRPNQLFEPFFVAIVKQIGSAIEIPFEQLMLHFSTSYSAARGCLLEAWKFYRKNRLWFIANFNNPIYREWLTEAIFKNRIAAPGFLSDPLIRNAWCGCAWGGSGMGQIDPLKESRAISERLNNMTTTHEDEYTSIHGGSNGSWESAMKRRKREEELIQRRGLVSYPVDPDEQQNLEELEDGK